MLFTRRRKCAQLSDLTYGDSSIRRVECMKILGLSIDARLTFKSHIDKILSKARLTQRKLFPLLKRNSGLITQNKVAIYKLFIRPVLTYAISVWNCASVTNFRRIQVYQNKCLRSILNLRPDPFTYWQVPTCAIHDVAGTETMLEFMERITTSLYVKMCVHTNALIRSMTQGFFGERSHPFFAIRDLLE